MLHGKPQLKREQSGGARRQVTPLKPEHLRLIEEPSSVKSTHLPDPNSPSLLRKKPKLYIRGPRQPTKATIASTQSGDVEKIDLKSDIRSGSSKGESCPSRPYSTQGKNSTTKAPKTPNIATGLSPILPNERNVNNTGQPLLNFNRQRPSTSLAENISPRPPWSFDGAVDDMPPPNGGSRKGVGRAMILQAALRAGAMATEEEAVEAAVFESPHRRRTASFASTSQSAPVINDPLEESLTSSSSATFKYNNTGITGTTPIAPASTRLMTFTTTPKASESTTLPVPQFGTDSGYVTQISADESTRTRPLGKSPERSPQTLKDRLRRHREVELIVRSLESKKAKAAKSKKRKLPDDTTSDSIEPGPLLRLQSLAATRSRSSARDAKGRLLPSLEETGSNGAKMHTGGGAGTRSKKQRVVDANHLALSRNSFQAAVPVPEHWCICQRQSDERDMLQCDGEYCLVGWYHRRCTGLAVMPNQDGTSACLLHHHLLFFGPPVPLPPP